MKIRGHGNGLAIALAGLAVVIAASGSAYAVTATVVNIADPSTPSRVAKVDPAGRLSTVGATSTLNIASTVFPSDNHGDLFSAPTTATLAVTKFSITALAPTTASYDAYLFQVPVLSDGTCSPTIVERALGFSSLATGALGGQDYASPIAVAPISGAKYCLDLFFQLTGGTAIPGGFGMQITAYVVGGKYTGAGSPDAAPAAQPKSNVVGGH